MSSNMRNMHLFRFISCICKVSSWHLLSISDFFFFFFFFFFGGGGVGGGRGGGGNFFSLFQ